MRHTHHFYFSCSSLTDKEIQVDQLNALLEFEFENKPRNMVDFLEKNDWSTTYDIWRTLVSKNQRKVMDWILDKKIPFSFGEHKASCVMDAIARSDTPLYFLNWFKSANMVLSLPSDLSTVSQNNRSVIRQWFKEHNCDPLLLQQEQACFELVQKAKERLEAETKTIMDSLHTQNWMVYGGLLCFGLLLCLPAATTKKSR
jgi:hypothetical protein